MCSLPTILVSCPVACTLYALQSARYTLNAVQKVSEIIYREVVHKYISRTGLYSFVNTKLLLCQLSNTTVYC